jgi:DNA replication protein DnaC
MTAAVSRLAEPAADAAIMAAAKTLQLPTIRAQAGQLAAAAVKQRLSHKAFLAEVLTAECDEREARRRIRLVNEAKFPRTKRLADFDHTQIPDLTPAALGHLASGAWIDAGEPLVLLGDSGTGKTHSIDRPRHHRRRTRPSGALPDLRATGQRARRSCR